MKNIKVKALAIFFCLCLVDLKATPEGNSPVKRVSFHAGVDQQQELFKRKGLIKSYFKKDPVISRLFRQSKFINDVLDDFDEQLLGRFLEIVLGHNIFRGTETFDEIARECSGDIDFGDLVSQIIEKSAKNLDSSTFPVGFSVDNLAFQWKLICFIDELINRYYLLSCSEEKPLEKLKKFNDYKRFLKNKTGQNGMDELSDLVGEFKDCPKASVIIFFGLALTLFY